MYSTVFPLTAMRLPDTKFLPLCYSTKKQKQLYNNHFYRWLIFWNPLSKILRMTPSENILQAPFISRL